MYPFSSPLNQSARQSQLPISTATQIHYGHASLTPVTRTPALCVLPRSPTPLDVQACARHLAAALQQHGGATEQPCGSGDGDAEQSSSSGRSAEWAVMTYDQCYAHKVPLLKEALAAIYSGPLHVVWADVAPLRLDPPAAAAASAKAGASAYGHGGSGHGGGGGGGCCSRGDAADQPQQQLGPCCQAAAAETGRSSSATATAEAAAVSSCITDTPPSSGSNNYTVPPLGGLVWHPPCTTTPTPTTSSSSSSSNSQPAAAAGCRCMLWLGPPAGPALTHLQLTHTSANWVALDPSAGFSLTRGLCEGLDRLLRRRYYLVEGARGASIIGLLVGTLGAAGYLEALEGLRRLAQEVGWVGWVGSTRLGRSVKCWMVGGCCLGWGGLRAE